MIISIFSSSLEIIGLVNIYTALSWVERFTEVGEFTLWAPLTEENAELLIEDNFIWTGGSSIGIIETVKKSSDDEGTITVQVSGRLSEQILERRIIWGKFYTTSDYPTEIMRNLIDTQIINPTDSNREISIIELYDSQADYGELMSLTRSYKNVLSVESELASAYALSPKLIFDRASKKLIFRVFQGVDRSVNQSENDHVIISTDFSDIMQSEYNLDKSTLATTALVGGEGEDIARITVDVNTDYTDLERREIFVDASSLSSTDDEGVSLDPAVYLAMLESQGEETLSENQKSEQYDATIRTFGDTVYTLGVDYFLGDTITIVDKKLFVQVSAVISEVETSYDDYGEATNITLGVSLPTITKLVKRRIK